MRNEGRYLRRIQAIPPQFCALNPSWLNPKVDCIGQHQSMKQAWAPTVILVLLYLAWKLAARTDGLSLPTPLHPPPFPFSCPRQGTPAWQVGGHNMLRLQIGSASFEVSLADIQKHPGTLLHDLVDLEPEATRQPVLLDPTTP